MIVSVGQDPGRQLVPDQHMQVRVNVQAEVIAPESARRKANRWLLDNVGILLGAENPELLLAERLLWRCDVVLGVPDMTTPGGGRRYRVGKIHLDAITGDVEDAATLIQELQTNAASAVD
jgi:hypothetical protein